MTARRCIRPPWARPRRPGDLQDRRRAGGAGQDPRSPQACRHGARASGQAGDALGPGAPGVSARTRGIRVVTGLVACRVRPEVSRGASGTRFPCSARRRWDSNPRDARDAYRFSRPAPSTRLGHTSGLPQCRGADPPRRTGGRRQRPPCMPGKGGARPGSPCAGERRSARLRRVGAARSGEFATLARASSKGLPGGFA